MTRQKNHAPISGSIFDLYLVDRKALISGSYTEGAFLREIEKYFAGEFPAPSFRFEFEEKGFGLGADWVVAAVHWLATDDLVNALAHFGGLVGLARLLLPKLNEIRSKRDGGKVIYLGLAAARLVAVDVLDNGESSGSDIELLFEHEIERNKGTGFIEKDYVFFFEVPGKEGIDNAPSYYFVHIDWDGVVHSIIRV